VALGKLYVKSLFIIMSLLQTASVRFTNVRGALVSVRLAVRENDERYQLDATIKIYYHK